MKLRIEHEGFEAHELVVTKCGDSAIAPGRVDFEVELVAPVGEVREVYLMRGVKPDLKPLALAHEALTAFGLGRLERGQPDKSIPPTVPPAHEDMRKMDPATAAGLTPPADLPEQ